MYTYVLQSDTEAITHSFGLFCKSLGCIFRSPHCIAYSVFFPCKHNWCTIAIAVIYQTTRIMNIDQMSINGLIAISLGIIAIMLMLIHEQLKNRDKKHHHGKR